MIPVHGSPGTGRLPTAHTPVVRFDLPLRDRTCLLSLKLEGANEFGSIKARTAFGLLAAAEQQDQLYPGATVIESTSGNLGVALARMCRRRGYRCTLVIDADTTELSRDQMVAEGAQLIVVSARNGVNAVVERVATVRRVLLEQPRTVWTNQYSSPANPAAHRDWTAPELAEDCGPADLDAVVAAVSTGGTAAGLSDYFRRHHPATTMVVVDAVGSVATGGTGAPRPYKIPGFGSGRTSEFLTPADWDLLIRVDDVHAAMACTVLEGRTGLALGGSAGGAVLGAVIAALRVRAISRIGVVCADMGRAYRETVYTGVRRAPLTTGDHEVRAALDALRHVTSRSPNGIRPGTADVRRADP